tara:strand:- start:183 stop:833 length:651 start_codon:yes stop_codon:yes gene_type:complete
MSKKFFVTNNNSGNIGNFYNKYASNNFIEKFIINNYFKNLLDICKKNSITNFIDLGCGEGKWLYEFSKKGFDCVGIDHSDEVIKLAKKNLGEINIDIFKCSLYENNFHEKINSIILKTGIKNIFFLEVLEHLTDPSKILSNLKKVKFERMIITVPNEPLWRFLNCCRLKYLKDFGNTPGHINHFSNNKIKNLLRENFTIIDIKLPLPFLMYLIKND